MCDVVRCSVVAGCRLVVRSLYPIRMGVWGEWVAKKVFFGRLLPQRKKVLSSVVMLYNRVDVNTYNNRS